jgi:hypothetical protein
MTAGVPKWYFSFFHAANPKNSKEKEKTFRILGTEVFPERIGEKPGKSLFSTSYLFHNPSNSL